MNETRLLLHLSFYSSVNFSFWTSRKDSDSEAGRGGGDSNSSGISDGMVGGVTRSNTLYSLTDQTDGSSPKGAASPTDEGKLLMVQFTVDRLSLEVRMTFGNCVYLLAVDPALSKI